MAGYLYVMPECYIDTNLIEYLLNGNVNHQHSCTKVVKMLDDKFRDKFAVGIIDNDKVKMGILQHCDRLAATEHLTIYKHRERPQFIITIAPAADGFALRCAKDLNKNPEDFELPSELKDFTKISKSVTSNRDSRFKKLFIAIKDHPEMKALKDTLNYLVTTHYSADVATVRNLFSH